ncbi:MAG: hypothetical protein ACRDX8_12110, partial [Acidimicrobiales bacterium]
MSLFRFAWRQAWAARGRTLALATGVLVAAVAFVALISTVTTSRLQVHRLAASHFRPAYDILVRPPHSQTHLEATRHLIAENYLSGLFGGITTAQWHEILHTAGVSVAAPIANVGYVLLYADVNLPVPVNRDPVQLYRVKVTWRTYNGLAHFPGAVDYVYVNRVDPFLNVMPYGPVQVPRGGNTLDVCIHYVASEPSTPLAPFDWLSCFSTRNPGASSLPGKPPGAIVFFQFPLLVTGIDPHQEALLLHLPSTVVADRYLKEGEGLLPSTGMGDDRASDPGSAGPGPGVDPELPRRVVDRHRPASADPSRCRRGRHPRRLRHQGHCVPPGAVRRPGGHGRGHPGGRVPATLGDPRGPEKLSRGSSRQRAWDEHVLDPVPGALPGSRARAPDGPNHDQPPPASG